MDLGLLILYVAVMTVTAIVAQFCRMRRNEERLLGRLRWSTFFAWAAAGFYIVVFVLIIALIATLLAG